MDEAAAKEQSAGSGDLSLSLSRVFFFAAAVRPSRGVSRRSFFACFFLSSYASVGDGGEFVASSSSSSSSGKPKLLRYGLRSAAKPKEEKQEAASSSSSRRSAFPSISSPFFLFGALTVVRLCLCVCVVCVG